MRNWGIIITVFYSIILIFLLSPMWMYLWPSSLSNLENPYLSYLKDSLTSFGLSPEVWIAILIGGQALLLFLSVDTSWRRNKPRQHVLVTSLLAGMLTGLLAFFYLWSFAAAIFGDGGYIFDSLFSLKMFVWWLGLWCFWGSLFYWYYRTSSGIVNKAVSWLLAGSVLELLIAVPAHVIVRHRDDCSAPVVTSWGIVTGIAVMLLCFGPGVLTLYKKRIDGYTARRSETPRK